MQEEPVHAKEPFDPSCRLRRPGLWQAYPDRRYFIITEDMIAKWTPGTYLADYRIRQQKAVCEVWPRGKVPASFHEPIRSNVPVLLISGERDPVTPPEFAEEAARFMTNRLHVVVPRGSHGAAGECTNNLIRDLLDRASIQGLDPSCAATVYGPTQFMKP